MNTRLATCIRSFLVGVIGAAATFNRSGILAFLFRPHNQTGSSTRVTQMSFRRLQPQERHDGALDFCGYVR
jgi:hypothetical protein